MSNSSETEDEEVPTSVDSFVRSHHKQLTIIGVFGALAVYIYQLKDVLPTEYVGWGIAGSLIVFLAISANTIYKGSTEIVGQEDFNWAGRTATGAVIVGLGGVMYSVFRVSMEYLGESSMLLAFLVGIVAFVVYMDQFPWEKFNEANVVSEKRAEKIEKVPHVANTFSVVLVLSSELWLPEMPKIDGYRPLVVFPVMIAMIIFHYVFSHLLRHWHFRRDKTSPD